MTDEGVVGRARELLAATATDEIRRQGALRGSMKYAVALIEALRFAKPETEGCEAMEAVLKAYIEEAKGGELDSDQEAANELVKTVFFALSSEAERPPDRTVVDRYNQAFQRRAFTWQEPPSELSIAEAEASGVIAAALVEAAAGTTAETPAEPGEDEPRFWKTTHLAIERYMGELYKVASAEGAEGAADAGRGGGAFIRVADAAEMIKPERVREFRERNPDATGPVAGAGAWFREKLREVRRSSWITTAPEIRYGAFIDMLRKQPDWKDPEVASR